MSTIYQCDGKDCEEVLRNPKEVVVSIYNKKADEKDYYEFDLCPSCLSKLKSLLKIK